MDYATDTFFESLGLTKNERKIYEASLELGETTPTELSRRAKVHRVATYALIDNLVKRGLLSQTDARRGRHISPTHPREVLEIIKKEQRRLKKLELKYETLLPELTALYRNVSVRPRVQFFEGVHGLEQINSDIINTLKELPEDQRITYSYANPNYVARTFEGYVDEEGGYIDLRKEYGIFNRAIALDGEVTRAIAPRDAEELREMIVLPQQLFPFKSDITLYGDKMAIQALEHELIGVIIESREIVQDQMAIFEIAWAGAEALAQKHGTYRTTTTGAA